MTNPNWRRADVDAAAPILQRLDDFYHGTDAVRAAGQRYIAQLEKESDKNWNMRKAGVAAPGHLTRTVDGSVGRIFAVAPTLEPNGYARIADEWADIDGMGTHGDVWLSKASAWAILDGFAVALVDAPAAPQPLVSLPDAARYRPRWILYRRAQVLNWRTAVIDGRVMLTMVALAESADVEDGKWGLKSEPRVRVLRRSPAGLVTAELYAERKGTSGRDEWVLIEGPMSYDGPTEIPIAVLAGGKMTAPLMARPPLLSLCDKVIEFYQVASDIRHYERLGCFPQPVVRGQLSTLSGDGKLVLGPTSAVQVSSDGDFHWAELSGSSMTVLRENQQLRRQEIGMLGLSFLVGETRSAETAQSKRIDSAAENATLADAARGIEDGANVALAFHASYAGVQGDAPTVSLNKNLAGDTLDAVMLRVLLDMRTAGELTVAEFREILSRGRVIPAEMATEDAVLAAELESAVRQASVAEPDPIAA